jgi:protein-tyrosine phosphatase
MIKKTAVLMVCMGNICRSPTAEGVLRHRLAASGLADAVEVDSAGTHAHHIGNAPDERSQAHAARRGYDLGALRARRVTAADYEKFDYLLAMDWDNLALLEEDCPPRYRDKVGLMMRFARQHTAPTVPDPYYGGDAGFERVLDYLEDACDGLIDVIVARQKRD